MWGKREKELSIWVPLPWDGSSNGQPYGSHLPKGIWPGSATFGSPGSMASRRGS